MTKRPKADDAAALTFLHILFNAAVAEQEQLDRDEALYVAELAEDQFRRTDRIIRRVPKGPALA